MAEYKTPGVYVEEISTFPATVVRVATAVPVFIGYTELAGPGANVPIKVQSLVEYTALFGGEPTTNGRTIAVTLDTGNVVTDVALTLRFYLYQSLLHFYANGGGDAYICSVGTYGAQTSATRKTALKAPLDLLTGSLMQVDEPTLVLVPDAYGLDTAAELGEVQVAVLAHCNKMQDRFGIFDVMDTGAEGADATTFRGAIGTSYLKYGAAYYPKLKTSITPSGLIDGNSYTLTVGTLESVANTAGDTILLDYAKALSDMNQLKAGITIGAETKTFTEWYETTLAAIASGALLTGTNAAAILAATNHLKLLVLTRMEAMTAFLYAHRATVFKIGALNTARDTFVNTSTVGGLKTALEAMYKTDYAYGQLATVYTFTGAAPLGIVLPASYEVLPVQFQYGLLATGAAMVAADVKVIYGLTPANERVAIQNAIAYLGAALASLKASYDALTLIVTRSYQTVVATSAIAARIDAAIRSTGYTLPPSGAMAGVYASVDAARGVWKAPANVSLTAVTSVAKMRDTELDDLNVSTTGKSINAIREFRGQGILVYGARTLAGNDNEWRYVPVRRLFIMVEESVKKATEPYVFEANDARTWLGVKSMIENFLTGIWRDGGLAGAVPKDAFFVKVGLGQTMTAQDILEGKLIIEIGMAAVRPAEFVILKFSHKLQES